MRNESLAADFNPLDYVLLLFCGVFFLFFFRPERAQRISPGQSVAPPWVRVLPNKIAALKGQGKSRP